MSEISLKIPPFVELLRMEIIQASEGRSRIRLPFEGDLCRAGFIHGGDIASLADSAVAVALLSLDPNARDATIDLDIKYLARKAGCCRS